LDRLRGLGGAIENFELQKTGPETPLVYRARLFYRQTFNLGGRRNPVDSNPLMLGTAVNSRRLVFTVGNYSVIDIFDKNNVTGDPRQTFFNEAFMTESTARSSRAVCEDIRGNAFANATSIMSHRYLHNCGHVAVTSVRGPQCPDAQSLRALRPRTAYDSCLRARNAAAMLTQAARHVACLVITPAA
jgi:hypothetical protein